jgi:hypothetical protein
MNFTCIPDVSKPPPYYPKDDDETLVLVQTTSTYDAFGYSGYSVQSSGSSIPEKKKDGLLTRISKKMKALAGDTLLGLSLVGPPA